MQVVIDIDEKYRKLIMEPSRELGFFAIQSIRKSIINGTPLPKNATNGDIIKLIVPCVKVNQVGVMGLIYYDAGSIGSLVFDEDWWNAPYRKEQP